MYDAVHLFAKALHDLDTSQQIDIHPLSCDGQVCATPTAFYQILKITICNLFLSGHLAPWLQSHQLHENCKSTRKILTKI